MDQAVTTLLSYLQSPALLPVAILPLVSAFRQLSRRADGTMRIDGPWRVALLAAFIGAALAGLQQALPFLIAFAVAHPLIAAIVGSVVGGAGVGFYSFGGHDLLAGLLSRVGSVTTVLPAANPPTEPK
jgi:hypothetical protein